MEEEKFNDIILKDNQSELNYQVLDKFETNNNIVIEE